MVGSIWVAEVANPPPQEVLKADFLCQCFLHCTQVILFTWAFLLSGPEEKRRQSNTPSRSHFSEDPVWVFALSTTLGKGREMFFHSLEPEGIPSAGPVFLLAERFWMWTVPFTVDSGGRSQSMCGAREEDSPAPSPGPLL